jgi:hypothetical protein
VLRSVSGFSLIVLVAATIVCAESQAADAGPSRKHHPWGRCSPGAWKIVHVVTKSIDERGLVSQTSTTETKTTLTELDDEGVTLEVRAIVESAGRRFDPEPQIIKQSFRGELGGRDAKITDRGTGTVMVEDTKVPCRIAEMEYSDAISKTTTTVYYSDSFSPYILKRTSTTADLEGKHLSDTLVEVVAVNMPCEVLGEMKCAAQVKTIHRNPNGTISTLAFVSPDVPGGVVGHTSKELDKSGRLVRQSVLKLVAFSFDPEEERTGIFGRKRPSRYRKTTSATPQ